MTPPREIIARADVEFLHGVPVNPGIKGADAIIAALTSRGIHLMTDADLAARDDAVLERAMQVAEENRYSAWSIPMRIAALKGGKP